MTRLRTYLAIATLCCAGTASADVEGKLKLYEQEARQISQTLPALNNDNQDTNRRLSDAQVTFSLDRPRCGQRSERSLEHGLALHVEDQAVLRDPPAVLHRLGQRHEPARRILLQRELAVLAVPGRVGLPADRVPDLAHQLLPAR